MREQAWSTPSAVSCFGAESRPARINDAFHRGEKCVSNYPLFPPRNLEAPLHGRPRKAAFEPRRHAFQIIELHQVARTVIADQIAHPAKRRVAGRQWIVRGAVCLRSRGGPNL